MLIDIADQSSNISPTSQPAHDSSQTVHNSHKTALPRKSDRPPPIIVYGITNYPKFDEFLKDKQVHDCTRKATNSGLILTTSSTDNYRKLHSALRIECNEKKF